MTVGGPGITVGAAGITVGGAVNLRLGSDYRAGYLKRSNACDRDDLLRRLRIQFNPPLFRRILDDQHFLDRLRRQAPAAVFPRKIQHQGNGLRQVFPGCRLGLALPVGLGNLQAIGQVPILASLNYRRELVNHPT